MKIILTCRITQYFNDAIGVADGGWWVLGVGEDYKIVDVDEDLLDEFMRGENRKLDFKIEADVELNQLSYTAHKTIYKGGTLISTVNDINVTMKDDAFTDGYITKAHENEVLFELDRDDNKDLINKLELIETRGVA